MVETNGLLALTGLAPLGPKDPQTVGPYRLLALLGSGGMGRVYLGQSPAGRRLAIKVIRPDLAEDTAFRARFGREVAAARQVNPLFTAPVVDADPAAREPWLATTYIDGISLERQVLEHGPMPPSEAAALAAGLAEALSSIHDVGLVHRDLKPSNVLIDETGPHIIDFGLALGVADKHMTTSLVVGTPSYMAPERLRGEDAGPPSDIFSFGATLVFATTGHDLVGDESVYEQILQIAEGHYNLIGVPSSLRSLIVRCVSYAPKDRPTAPELTRILVALSAKYDQPGGLDAPVAGGPVRLVRQRLPMDGYAPDDPPFIPGHQTLGRQPYDDEDSGGVETGPRVSRRAMLGVGGGVAVVALAGTVIAAASSVFGHDSTNTLPPVGDGTTGAGLETTPPVNPAPSGAGSSAATVQAPIAGGSMLWHVTPSTVAASNTNTGAASQDVVINGSGAIIALRPRGVAAINRHGAPLWSHSLPGNLLGLWQWNNDVLVTDGAKIWIVEGASGKPSAAIDPIAMAASSLRGDHAAPKIGPNVAIAPDRAFVTVGDAMVGIRRSGRRAWVVRPGEKAVYPLATDGQYLVSAATDPFRLRIGVYTASGGLPRRAETFPSLRISGLLLPGLIGGLPLGGGSDDQSIEACIANGMVVIRDGSNVHAVGATNPAKDWHVPDGAAAKAIEVAGNLVIVAGDKLAAYAIDGGPYQWSANVAATHLAIATTPQLIVAVSDNEIAGLDFHGGTKWRVPMPADVMGGAVVRVTTAPHVAYVTLRRTIAQAAPSPSGGSATTGAGAAVPIEMVDVVAIALDTSARA
jgi:hypothetical protein